MHNILCVIFLHLLESSRRPSLLPVCTNNRSITSQDWKSYFCSFSQLKDFKILCFLLSDQFHRPATQQPRTWLCGPGHPCSGDLSYPPSFTLELLDCSVFQKHHHLSILNIEGLPQRLDLTVILCKNLRECSRGIGVFWKQRDCKSRSRPCRSQGPICWEIF